MWVIQLSTICKRSIRLAFPDMQLNILSLPLVGRDVQRGVTVAVHNVYCRRVLKKEFCTADVVPACTHCRQEVWGDVSSVGLRTYFLNGGKGVLGVW